MFDSFHRPARSHLIASGAVSRAVEATGPGRPSGIPSRMSLGGSMSPAVRRQYEAATAAGTIAHTPNDSTLGDRVREDIRYSCATCYEAFFFARDAAEHMRIAGHHRMRSFTPMGGLR